MEKALLVRCLGNSPVLRIVDFFQIIRLFDYSKSEILKKPRHGQGDVF